MSSSLTVLLHLMVYGSTATLNYDFDGGHANLWNQARPIYPLATPSIIYSARRGNGVYLPGDLTLVSGEKYMVGYIKTLKVFNYVGCIPEVTIWSYPAVQYTDISSDPGQCFSVCRGQFKVFGILKTTCYCLNTKEIQRFTRCTIECTSPNNTVCGGYNGKDNYVSVYEYVDEMAGMSDSKFCLAYNPDTSHSFWDNCGDKKYGSCQTRRYSYSCHSSNINSMPYIMEAYWSSGTQGSGTWKEYVNKCFRQDYPPIDIRVPVESVGGEIGLWTGKIRSWVIEKSTGAPTGDTNYGYVGYVTVDEAGSYRLLFSMLNGDILWKLVCHQDDPDKTPFIQPISKPIISELTTANDIHTHTRVTVSKGMQTTTGQLLYLGNNHMSSVNENTKGDAMDEYKKTTSKQVAAVSSNRKSDNVEKTTGSVMLAVYVVSPCVLVTLVVVGTICFIKRNRRRNDDAYVDTGIRFNNTKPTPGVANAAYDGNAIQAGPEKVQDHSYWVLEKEPDNAAVCPDDDVNDYDTTTTRKTQVHNDNDGNVYNTLEASSVDTYDHTAVDIIDKKKHNNDNDGNFYNIFEASSDDTYDHTGYEINKIKNIDDTYNHAGNECDTENEYSTANKWKDRRDSEQTFDDTYNHI